MSKACFRVNYFIGGQAVSAFVVAESESDASSFLGVTDGSAQVSRAAYPVEVVGVDKQHAPIPPIAPTVAPFDIPKSASSTDIQNLQAQLDEIKQLLSGGAKPKVKA